MASFSTRDLKKQPFQQPHQHQHQALAKQNATPLHFSTTQIKPAIVSLWSAEDERKYDNDDDNTCKYIDEQHSEEKQQTLSELTQKSYHLRSSGPCPNRVEVAKTNANKAYKSSKRLGCKKTSSRSKDELRHQIEELKNDIQEFAKKMKKEELSLIQNESEDEDFDIFTIFRWIGNMFSYRLYKSEDIHHMKTELAKHKALCQEMSQRSNFWKGKICHFLETGQQNWNISDKYFVSLGQTNNLALE